MCLSRTNPKVSSGASAQDPPPRPVPRSTDSNNHAKQHSTSHGSDTQIKAGIASGENPARYGPQPTVDKDPNAPKPSGLRAAQLWMREQGSKPGFGNAGAGLAVAL